ncbi:hypothetical protein AB0442_28550, partial [Kitasatospora sp. NPDC085895]
GVRGEAMKLYRRAVAAGDDSVLGNLARLLEQAGDITGAEAMYRRAVQAGHSLKQPGQAGNLKQSASKIPEGQAQHKKPEARPDR